MSKTSSAAFIMSILLWLLLVAGCVPDAHAHASRQPPRYEQEWHRAWQRSVPKTRRHATRRYGWQQTKPAKPPTTAQHDRGMRWHGYRSE